MYAEEFDFADSGDDEERRDGGGEVRNKDGKLDVVEELVKSSRSTRTVREIEEETKL